MADEPIIITGGSVTIDFSDKFKDDGSGGGGKKKYKIKDGRLKSLQINTNTPITLNPGDKITIIYGDDTP